MHHRNIYAVSQSLQHVLLILPLFQLFFVSINMCLFILECMWSATYTVCLLFPKMYLETALLSGELAITMRVGPN